MQGEDPQLTGVISLSAWKRICKKTTNLPSIDWILLARLVGGASVNNIRYMETLNRFAFKIASQARIAHLAVPSSVCRLESFKLTFVICPFCPFLFHLQVVESELASSVLASIYFQMMQADESLQHLVGKLCQAKRSRLGTIVYICYMNGYMSLYNHWYSTDTV